MRFSEKVYRLLLLLAISQNYRLCLLNSQSDFSSRCEKWERIYSIFKMRFIELDRKAIDSLLDRIEDISRKKSWQRRVQHDLRLLTSTYAFVTNDPDDARRRICRTISRSHVSWRRSAFYDDVFEVAPVIHCTLRGILWSALSLAHVGYL